MPRQKPKRVKIPARLVDRYRSGELTSADLGRMLGAAVVPVLEELRRLGVDTSKRTRRLMRFARDKGFDDPTAIHDRVVGLYRQGLSLRQVARRTGFTVEGVRQVLLRRRVRRRPPSTGKRVRGPDEVNLKEFGRRLVSLRKQAGMTRRALAARCGVGESTLWSLETGQRRPEWRTLDKLTKALRVGPEAFGVEQKA
jgi:transcriptional regulator with XRE-family HTH domain